MWRVIIFREFCLKPTGPDLKRGGGNSGIYFRAFIFLWRTLWGNHNSWTLTKFKIDFEIKVTTITQSVKKFIQSLSMTEISMKKESSREQGKLFAVFSIDITIFFKSVLRNFFYNLIHFGITSNEQLFQKLKSFFDPQNIITIKGCTLYFSKVHFF